MDDASTFASHAIMKATHPGAFRWDVSKNLVTGDLNLARMFEMKEKHVMRGVSLESLVEKIHPADRALVYTSLGAALEKCSFYWAHFRLLRASGELQVQGFGRCERFEHIRVVCGVLLDLTGFLPDISLTQEDADIEQIAHSCALARALALRNGYTDVAKALQFALDDVHHHCGNAPELRT